MNVTRTTISLPKDQLEQIDQAANDLNLSRNGLISLALKEFFERRKKQQLMEALNQAYADDDQVEEAALYDHAIPDTAELQLYALNKHFKFSSEMTLTASYSVNR